MVRPSFVLLVFVAACVRAEPPAPKSEEDLRAPVTRAEVLLTLSQSEAALRRALKMPEIEERKGSDETPMTRAEIAKEFDRVLEAFRPKFRLTPVRKRWDPRAIDQNNPPEQRATFRKLVRWQVVAPVGPLVTGPAQTLEPEQYGDALGFLFSTLSWLTHAPSPKWTPKIQRSDD